jgi:hypothetical protein
MNMSTPQSSFLEPKQGSQIPHFRRNLTLGYPSQTPPPPPILDYFTFVVSPDTFDHSGMDKDVPRQGRPSWVQDVGSQDVAPGEDCFIMVEHGASSGSLQTGVIPTTPSSFMGTMAKTVPPSAITSRPQCHWYDICLLLPRLTAIVD